MLDIESSSLIDLVQNERGADNKELREQLKEVAEECERSGKSAFEVLQNFELFTKEELLEMMAENLGSYVWDPRQSDVDRGVIESIEKNVQYMRITGNEGE